MPADGCRIEPGAAGDEYAAQSRTSNFALTCANVQTKVKVD
jgi:hypothetical protein